MESNPPNSLEVSRLLDAYATPNEIPERVRAWRNERAWSLQRLANELKKLAAESEHPEYHLPKGALQRIEQHARNVSVVEAVGLALVFSKSLAELILPEGALDEAEDWRLFEQAGQALNRIRHESSEYGRLVSTLRMRLENLPRLKKFIEHEREAALKQDEAHHRANYDRRVEVKSWLAGGPLEEEPMEPYEAWRASHSLAPTPKQIAAEHVLGNEPIDNDHWYLGWEETYVRNQFQFRWRQQANKQAKGKKK